MSLNFSFSEENTMLVDAVGEAMKPWANERKTELREMVNNSVFPQDMWQTFADVGLLGMPNAGKSTLIAAMSEAKPRIADYPFTTLHPNLGVVRVGRLQSFVMADIPGLIEGASEGAGLGIRFLKHLARTRLLIHLVDIAPLDGVDPAESVRVVEQELLQFGEGLADKPRWLVLNKIDLLAEGELEERRDDLLRKLAWSGPVMEISAATGSGTKRLAAEIMRHLDTA